jgi:predicted Rossmann fold nucleotide-binding protein DprA/Smf involved in DNA uptake
LEQSREVFCVPGSIYSPASALTNRLPQEGAKLVMGVDDVLEELHLATSLGIPEALPGMLETQTEDEATVLGVLDFESPRPQMLDRPRGGSGHGCNGVDGDEGDRCGR